MLHPSLILKSELVADTDWVSVAWQAVQSGFQIKDAKGKPLEALTVFAKSLDYFRETAKAELERATGAKWVETEVKWILTVPAIWGDRAKQFMTEAAEKVRGKSLQ